MNNNAAIIFYDGECILCSKTVRYIIDHDKPGYFRFCALQSELAKEYFKPLGINIGMDTMILSDHYKIYSKSDAAFQIIKNTSSRLRYFYFLKIIPKKIRDFFYDLISSKRYKWFGKYENCQIPDKKIRARFLE